MLGDGHLSALGAGSGYKIASIFLFHLNCSKYTSSIFVKGKSFPEHKGCVDGVWKGGFCCHGVMMGFAGIIENLAAIKGAGVLRGDYRIEARDWIRGGQPLRFDIIYERLCCR